MDEEEIVLGAQFLGRLLRIGAALAIALIAGAAWWAWRRLA